MPLATLNNLSIGFRGPPLLDGITCQIESGQQIGLLGRNGTGKTTFMRILSGQVQPDGGEIRFAPQTHVSLLPQDVPVDLQGDVAEIVLSGIPQAANHHQDPHEQAWQNEHRVDQILSRMELDRAAEFQTLSSGMKRRVLLARCLVSDPDLLLLDEPTNHLDMEAISWLEDFLSSRWNGTFIFVTHDRMFLRKLATRILELDRGRLFDWSCDYDTFLKRKDAALSAEEKQNALFDKKLAQEEAWIRTGIKARRTRNEGRVRALQQMRRVRSDRQSKVGKVGLKIDSGPRSGNLIAEVDDISFAYDDTAIIQDFSTSIMRGDKIGIIGPNGAGKTTLLRLLLGQLPPSSGHVRLGINLTIAYFDQLRGQLDEQKTVQENVGEGGDAVYLEGKSKHILGYLQDFLFTPERARTEVRFLSGGERNRILLAKLFAKPANVIVLDEPTNDLDTETLELLEERLVEFQGTLLLVSHDRAFLNNVATSCLAFEPTGVKEYVGGYDDWVRQRPDSRPTPKKKKNNRSSPAEKSSIPQTPERSPQPATPPRRKLTFNQQRELDDTLQTIETLEAALAKIHATMTEPEFFQQTGARIAAAQTQLKQFETELNAAYQRWEELEAT